MPTIVDFLDEHAKMLEGCLHEKDSKLYQRFQEIQEKIFSQVLSRQQTSDDTDGSLTHIPSVESIIGRLVPHNILDSYSSIELFVLLIAVYFHDIGRIKKSGSQAISHHAEIGRDLIVDNALELGLEQPEALAVAYIVEGHGPVDIEQLPEQKGVSPYGTIRIRYFAALLRLADDLDMSFRRAPRLARKLVEPAEKIAGKWDMRQCVDEVLIDPKKWLIEIQATPKNNQDRNLVSREIEAMNGRLFKCRRFLRSIEEIGLYYAIIELAIDPFWLKRNAEQGESAVPIQDHEPQMQQIPANGVAVLLMHDSVSLDAYEKVIAPCLREAEFEPFLIDELLPLDSGLERTKKGLSDAKLIIALLDGSSGASLHFRIGMAAGLGKRIMIFMTADSITVGDLCGLEIGVFDNEEDLQRQLKNVLSLSISASKGAAGRNN
jgi:hypothetical protein